MKIIKNGKHGKQYKWEKELTCIGNGEQNVKGCQSLLLVYEDDLVVPSMKARSIYDRLSPFLNLWFKCPVCCTLTETKYMIDKNATAINSNTIISPKNETKHENKQLTWFDQKQCEFMVYGNQCELYDGHLKDSKDHFTYKIQNTFSLKNRCENRLDGKLQCILIHGHKDDHQFHEG